MKLRLAFACIMIFAYQLVSAQVQEYWLMFTDKIGSPHSIEKPETFLSPKAIARRSKHGIAIDSSDLPVSPNYIQAIQKEGAQVLYTSKWFNAAAVTCNSATAERLLSLPYIKEIELVGFEIDNKAKKNSSGSKSLGTTKEAFTYGFGNQQLIALNGQYLHQRGHRGAGKTIAVLDGGFIGIHNSLFFDSLRQSGQLLKGFDFVDHDAEVGHASTHGSKVLSVMAANRPGQLVGTAPQADYVCIRTEDRHREMRIEECNWVAGAEYADSVGADIINSSLGYSTFNFIPMDYQQEDFDGRTALISRAADIAFQKGILVVTSAGNGGATQDGKMEAPADAKQVIAVGASTLKGEVAPFSSYGQTSDGRSKPEIIAPGVDIAVSAVYGARVRTASGTSYAAPMIAGLAASLWSAFPDRSNVQIRHAIIASAESTKDCLGCGAGIPNFERAFQILSQENKKK